MIKENQNQEICTVIILAELVQAIEAKLGSSYKQSIINDAL
jgi:hypothetical protein